MTRYKNVHGGYIPCLAPHIVEKGIAIVSYCITYYVTAVSLVNPLL